MPKQIPFLSKDRGLLEYLDRLLEKLTLANGVGYAGNIKEVITQELKKLKIKAALGKDGSVQGSLAGKRKTGVMLACHIDEIGFMVSAIEEAGHIRFSEIGGSDPRILAGQEVVIMGKKTIKGYIGAKPPHLVPAEDRDKVLSIEQLFIDTGLKMEELRRFVKIGDCVSFLGKYQRLQGDLRSVKSLDNRASVACGISVLKELSKQGSPCHLHLIATSQEEYTGLGARIHSYRLPIEYAIVIDVTHAEHPDLKDYQYFPLRKGPVIGRGATIPQKLSGMLVQVAQEDKLPFQIEAMPTYTGTDADDIAFNRAGIATCIISIPLRYMHTPVEVVSLKDIENTCKLVVSFLKKLVSKQV